MVRTLLAAVLMLALHLPAGAAEASLWLELRTSQPHHGKPITVDLVSLAESPALSSIDLSPWDADFVIETLYPPQPHEASGGRVWRVRLYPRQAGTLTLPALHFDGARSEPLRLTIAPASEKRASRPLAVSSTVSNSEVWVNQAIDVAMTVVSAFDDVVLQADPAQHDGLEIVQHPPTRRTRQDARTAHRLAWSLYPQTQGEFTLQLPPVRYRRGGSSSHRFHPPAMTFHARALPAFVPPTLPVGQLAVTATLPSRAWLYSDELQFLELTVRQPGPPGQRPAAILRQLVSDKRFAFYPAQALANDRYRIPFAARQLGRVELPIIRLQYFDPETGRIVSRYQSLGSVWVLAAWMPWLMAGSALVFLVWLGHRALVRFRHTHSRWLAYRNASDALAQASSASEIKGAVMPIADAEGWTGPRSLGRWHQHWRRHHPSLPLYAAIMPLENALHSGQPGDMAAVRQTLHAACLQRLRELDRLRMHRLVQSAGTT